MSVRVPVNPAVVEWATSRSQDPAALLENDKDIQKWIDGDKQPTWVQLKKFAKTVGTPVGFFLLDEIPVRPLPIVDFRVGYKNEHTEPSPELWDVLDICMNRQEWYREYAIEFGLEADDFVGRAAEWDVQSTASDMRRELDFEVGNRKGTRNEIRKHLTEAFEALGGLPVFNSMVNDNVHRPLDPEEFRGFSLVDPIAPLVFVNSAQTLNGQIFTFAHELAHIWRGEGGLGNSTEGSVSQSRIEQWCNSVANEFLVPTEHLKDHFSQSDHYPESSILDKLAQVYHCGTLVVLTALRRANLVPQEGFEFAYRTELERLGSYQKDRGGGGDIRRVRKYRIGENFALAVANELSTGRLTPTYAKSLTGVSTLESFDNFVSFIQENSH